MRILPIFLFLFAISGCTDAPDKNAVSGTITLDGKPVEGGLIRFVPADGNSQPADGPIVNGAYTVTVSAGDKKVEITWSKPTGPVVADTAVLNTQKSIEMIPAKYNAPTTLLYTVVKGPQTKEFQLTTK